MPRKYRLKRRAEQQEETREKIVKAALELHGSVGPARSSIRAIAERAGVERATVYRHFPDEEALFAACSSHCAAAHPLPDPARWRALADPRLRLETALLELYDYHRRTEAMMDKVLRDAPLVPALQKVAEPHIAYFAQASELLSEDWHVSKGQRPWLKAAIGHALDFSTWRSLVRQQGLEESQAVALMVAFVRGVARSESSLMR